MKNEQSGRPKSVTGNTATLRKRAERLLDRTPPASPNEDTREMRELLHELSVHEIELEMQNEELLRTRSNAENLHEKYFALFDLAPIGYAGLEKSGRIATINLAGAAMLGMQRRYACGRHFQTLVAREDIPVFDQFLQNVFRSGRKDSCVIRLAKGGETIATARIEGVLPDPPDDPPVCLAAIIDISDQRAAEMHLRESTEYLTTLIDTANAPIVVWDTQHRITLFNRAFERLTGKPVARMIGEPLETLFPLSIRDQAMARLRVADGGSVEDVEIPVATREGIRTILWNAAALHGPDGAWNSTIAQGQDITQRKSTETALRRKERQLSESLAEKEVLLAEIHHRVKNNLASFISLLSLEGSYEDSPKARQLKHDLQNRARTMALIHEILYRTRNYNHVNMDEYLSLLAKQVISSYNAADTVRATIAAGNMSLDLARATPAGLIINELMTNSLKYAWPPGFDCQAQRGEPPTISISLRKSNGGYIMEFADNGIGLPEEITPEKTKTLGLKLVSFLATHQLRADFSVTREQGTSFVFRLHDKVPS